jgi:TfuA protein
VYRPPAARGDLLAAVDRGATRIGLVDGVLIGPLAVSPGEVREAARRGARLWGAASLGALRAVECPCAMTGVGEVYDAFRDGHLTDDDELVGTFDEGFRTLSYPLVVLRDLLDESVRQAWIQPEARAAALQELKQRPFDRRSARDLERALAQAGVAPDSMATVLARLAAPDRRSIKARDALRLIGLLATLV